MVALAGAGFICAALPEARIVDLRREAMPLAWSLFRHSFTGRGNPFIYDLADIAAYMLLHRDLMAFWRARYGGQIVSLDYGALVASPEQTARALVEALGLGWSADCLAPERVSAPVLTASAAQVRQPIHTRADDAWRRYEEQLGPVRNALRRAGVNIDRCRRHMPDATVKIFNKQIARIAKFILRAISLHDPANGGGVFRAVLNKSNVGLSFAEFSGKCADDIAAPCSAF